MQGLTSTWLLVICAFNIRAFQAKEKVVRYDGAQLWRLFNIENFTLIETLEKKYGGDIWKEGPTYVDIALMSGNLKVARRFLTENNVSIKVLNSNIQKLFDAEKLSNSLTGYNAVYSKWKSGINWNEYQDLDVIFHFLREINKKYPNITTLYTIGKTVEGRKLKVLRISENPKKYKKIWIDGGIHAREWVSPAAVTYIMDQFISSWWNQSKYIKELTWFFMPVVNPDGYVYSQTTNRTWRKNRAKTFSSQCVGVDINRNFDVFWNFSTNDPCSGSYRGSAPGSELETKAITNFLLKRKLNFISFITLHSFGQFILYPFAAKEGETKYDADLQALGHKVVERIFQKSRKRYLTGRSSSLLTYSRLGGTSRDWSYVKLGVKYAFTMELRDAGDVGFLLPKTEIIPTAKDALILVTTVAETINKKTKLG